MYTVVHAFVDLFDGGFLYKVGDAYPREGTRPTDARIEELSSNKNKQNRPLIKRVEDPQVEEAAKPTRKKRGKKNETV